MPDHPMPDAAPPDVPRKSSQGPAESMTPGRHPLNWTLRGIPELDLFESPQQRERALRDIARHFGSPRRLDFWVGAGVLLVVALAALLFSRAVLRLVAWGSRIEEVLRIGFLLAVAALTVRLLHRWRAAGDLRRKLLALGIPVCLKCGYDLRGQTDSSPRCPECGAALDASLLSMINARRHSDRCEADSHADRSN